jgi:hypothetical protein
MTDEQEFPYRVVDGRQSGWLHTIDAGVYKCFPALPADRKAGEVETYWPLDRIRQERGPIRPVLPPSDADEEALRTVLYGAGTRAVGTACVALYRLAKQCVDADRGQVDAEPTARLTAGRPGSWESDRIKTLAWYVGADINPGGKRPRIREDEVAGVLDVLHRWVFAEDRYVEVAENLDSLLGDTVDYLGGWFAVTDQYLGRHSRMKGCTGHEGCVCGQETIRLYVCHLSALHSPLLDPESPCTCHDKAISYNPLRIEPGTWPCPIPARGFPQAPATTP